MSDKTAALLPIHGSRAMGLGLSFFRLFLEYQDSVVVASLTMVTLCDVDLILMCLVFFQALSTPERRVHVRKYLLVLKTYLAKRPTSHLLHFYIESLTSPIPDKKF